jgi:NDP-sugar pyrophosphorylase family protein
MSGTDFPHLNYVGDSVIGADCNFGAGTKIANLRLDNQNVKVAALDTGRRKLGAIVGDRVETGINTSINVGAMIGNNTLIGPGVVAKGIIVPDSKLF